MTLKNKIKSKGSCSKFSKLGKSFRNIKLACGPVFSVYGPVSVYGPISVNVYGVGRRIYSSELGCEGE